MEPNDQTVAQVATQPAETPPQQPQFSPEDMQKQQMRDVVQTFSSVLKVIVAGIAHAVREIAGVILKR